MPVGTTSSTITKKNLQHAKTLKGKVIAILHRQCRIATKLANLRKEVGRLLSNDSEAAYR